MYLFISDFIPLYVYILFSKEAKEKKCIATNKKETRNCHESGLFLSVGLNERENLPQMFSFFGIPLQLLCLL